MAETGLERIWRELGRTGYVRLYGYAHPHCEWTREWGRVWHYDTMYVIEAVMGGGRVHLVVKTIDLMTFTTRTDTYVFETPLKMMEKLREIVERENIVKLEIERRVVEPIN
jgi:hypothetical protein